MVLRKGKPSNVNYSQIAEHIRSIVSKLFFRVNFCSIQHFKDWGEKKDAPLLGHDKES